LRTEICTGARVCASWGVSVGVFIVGVQVGVFKLGVQVGAFCEFLVSILKPPHHVKVMHWGRNGVFLICII
jgi:hypothetical protein